MSIKIFRLKPENFPEKVALCGENVLDKKLSMGAQRKRSEWVYNNLRTGIIINTAIDFGEVVGQITALPLSNAPIELRGEEGIWYIPCIWMKPRAASSRLGELLVSSVVEDLENIARGIVTITSESWMNHKSFLERFGFVKSFSFERVGDIVDVMLLTFSNPNPDLGFIARKSFTIVSPRLDLFYSSHCPVHTETAYRLAKEHKALERRVQLVIHNANDRQTLEHYGRSWALVLDGEEDLLSRYLSGVSLNSLLERQI